MTSPFGVPGDGVVAVGADDHGGRRSRSRDEAGAERDQNGKPELHDAPPRLTSREETSRVLGGSEKIVRVSFGLGEPPLRVL